VAVCLVNAEQCRQCGRWRGTVLEGTSACERGFQGQPVIEHYTACPTSVLTPHPSACAQTTPLPPAPSVPPQAESPHVLTTAPAVSPHPRALRGDTAMFISGATVSAPSQVVPDEDATTLEMLGICSGSEPPYTWPV
jgi:hypothetical protein